MVDCRVRKATWSFVAIRSDWFALVFRAVMLALEFNPEFTSSIFPSSVVKRVGKFSNASRSSGSKAVFSSVTRLNVRGRPD